MLEFAPRASSSGSWTSPGQSNAAPSPATHRGAQDDKAVGVPVLLPEVQHLLQGELGAHVRVEHKEGLGAARQDLVSEVVDATARAQRRVLLQIPAGRGGQRGQGQACLEREAARGRRREGGRGQCSQAPT